MLIFNEIKILDSCQIPPSTVNIIIILFTLTAPEIQFAFEISASTHPENAPSRCNTDHLQRVQFCQGPRQPVDETALCQNDDIIVSRVDLRN